MQILAGLNLSEKVGNDLISFLKTKLPDGIKKGLTIVTAGPVQVSIVYKKQPIRTSNKTVTSQLEALLSNFCKMRGRCYLKNEGDINKEEVAFTITIEG